ncbi:MAG: hypothetical protein HYW25_06175 [Candidatus Aenigmarchaeota archaeon]|nr:hypothetical protein [Candidatus Aenigmarchaeota archaeon]
MLISISCTIKECQNFIEEVYGFHNDRHFSLWDMISNVERFAMRGLKGIRKNDREKARLNLLISLSWFLSVMNRLHIDLDEEVWNRFPHLCSYCAACPCTCKEEKVLKRRKAPVNMKNQPKTLGQFQEMFEAIYPHEKRTIDHAGVHLAEELGEFSEAILKFRGEHKDDHFNEVKIEAADVFSNMMGVFNSMKIDLAKELSSMFYNNCHECHKAPCECSFEFILKYDS